jgi:diaminohydroxyphosphoribosylaminopyrimidine deaminase/5-amino-6-(5-phosphoribosylamino)uracil reductase
MNAAQDPPEHDYMAHALRLAARGLYNTDPNPSVGCVIVAAGEVVGEGFTQPAAGPHAEAVALAAAGARARGATVYVSLEPCSHRGRNAPCCDALIEAGVARVVCASEDPNPRVAGAGIRALRAAGIDVAVGVLEAEARALNRGHFARMSRGRPWLRSKLAASVDGRTALANGASQWITGAAARRDVHRWRARSSAVLTGSGTLLADDPALTARLEGEDASAVQQPLRVVVDSGLRTPAGAKTLQAPGRVLIFTASEDAGRRRALEQRGAAIETVAADGAGHCRLADVLVKLAALEVNSVWVEAGPVLNGALLAAGLIDELIVYVAPQVLGDTARGMFTLEPLASLDERIELAFTDVRRVGADLRLILRPSNVAFP